MDKEILFDLRKKGRIDFKKVKEMGLFLEDLIGKERIVPMVVGPEKFVDDWRIATLNPLTSADKVTIDSYFAAIDSLKSEEGFKGRVSLQGVESLNYSNWDSPIIFSHIKENGVDGHIQTFGLSVYFSSGQVSDNVGYSAVSKISQTPLEKSFSRFVGPNTNYGRVLL